MNIFEKAKANGKKATAKKNDKPEIVIENSKLANDMLRLIELEEQLATVKSEYEMLKDNLKNEAIVPFTEKFEEDKRYPGSTRILFQSPKITESEFLFVPMDKYLKVDEDHADMLKGKYGEDVIEEETTFKFNPVLLEKYADVLNKLISGSKEIAEADKAKLIEADTKISVAKGTITKAHTFGVPVAEVLEDIKPIYMMKNPKIS